MRTRTLGALLVSTLAAVTLSGCSFFGPETIEAKTKPYTKPVDNFEIGLASACTFRDGGVDAPVRFVAAPSSEGTTVDFLVTVTSTDAAYEDWVTEARAQIPASGGVQEFTVRVDGVTEASWGRNQGCTLTLATDD